ncbi:reverse transcriptase family protein [Morganella morganii]|uniref:reverse transcriptase family protein n=1 Tax=Morganella morganii TaxID=582 RepID=UPI00141A0692|nr:reverse transcriptase family protein [Morganella morganii]NIH19346.1 RNA-directed DNA polymerase [Morganella morganii]
MKTPLPLFFSYPDAEQLLKALSQSLRVKYSSELARLEQLKLPPLVSWSVLSVAIGVSPQFITSLIKNKSKYYRVFSISKGKGKKKRTIEAPKVGLKIIQAWIAHHLSINTFLDISDSAYAFIPGKNGIYQAAKKHCNSKWVLSIDLKDFFHTITLDKVILALIDIGYHAEQASKLAEILTLNQRLPQGAPSSPVISNLVFKSTDACINEFIVEDNISYTRYADDLIFSGVNEDFDIDSLKDNIIVLLQSKGWIIAEEKLHIAKVPNRLKVHGFLVHGNKPRLTKGYRNKIRAYNHLLHAGRISEKDIDRIKGHVSYSAFIDSLND